MNEESNPLLERVFAASDEALADEAFVDEVMARTRALKRRRLWLGLAIGLAAIPVVALVAGPLNGALMPFLALVLQPVAHVHGRFAGPLLGPLNSVGAVFALAILAALFLYRRLFA